MALTIFSILQSLTLCWVVCDYLGQMGETWRITLDTYQPVFGESRLTLSLLVMTPTILKSQINLASRFKSVVRTCKCLTRPITV